MMIRRTEDKNTLTRYQYRKKYKKYRDPNFQEVALAEFREVVIELDTAISSNGRTSDFHSAKQGSIPCIVTSCGIE